MKYLSCSAIFIMVGLALSTHFFPLYAQCFDSPNGIAIDVENELIYWSEIGNSEIRSGNLDGSGGVNTLFDFTDGVFLPRDVAIDVDNGYIFWTEINSPFDDDYIITGPIEGAGTGPAAPIYSGFFDGLDAPNGIEVHPITGDIYWGEVGNQAIVQGDIISSPLNPLYLNGDGVEGPRGIAIDEIGGKIYWADFEPPNPTGRIFEANLDGTGTPTVLFDLGTGTFPHGLVVDPTGELIYWTDVVNNEIIVGELDGSGTPTVLFDYDDGVVGPRHLALDALGGKLYWAELEDAEIVFGNADGTGTLTSMFVKLWDGGGDGTTWGDAANWSDDTKPTAGDRVVIPIDVDVRIDGGIEEALEVFLELGSSLTIDDGATLNIDNDDCFNGVKLKENAELIINGTLNIELTFDDGIDLTLNSQLTVGATGVLTITDSFEDGIDLEGSTVVNMGMITIEGSYDDAINMISLDGIVSTFTNQGTINIDESDNEDAYNGIVVVGSTFSNFGMIGIDNSQNDGLRLNFDAEEGFVSKFVNQIGALLTINNTEDDAIELDDDDEGGDGNAHFINKGSLLVESAVDSGLDIQTGTTFTNYNPASFTGTGAGIYQTGGTIINNSEWAISDMIVGIFQTDGTITNNCTITIEQTEEGIRNIGGVLSNNNVIEITNSAAPTENALEVENEVNNNACGVINIQNRIEITNSGVLTNDGIITTEYTDDNTHNGTFVNNGEVRPSAYAFTGNAITGNAPVDGAVPAVEPLNSSACSGCIITDVPTLSEWGLLILALLFMTLGTVYLIQPILEAKSEK